KPGHLIHELMLAANQYQRALILVEIRGLARLLFDLGQLRGFLLQFALKLGSHIDHTGGGGLELLVAPDAVGDRGFIDRLGVARLARFEPACELASNQTGQPLDKHGNSPLWRGAAVAAKSWNQSENNRGRGSARTRHRQCLLTPSLVQVEGWEEM